MLKQMRHRLIKNLEDRDEKIARSKKIENNNIQNPETERVKKNTILFKPNFMTATESKKQYLMDSAETISKKIKNSVNLNKSNSNVQIKKDIIKRNKEIKVIRKPEIQLSAQDELK